MFCFFIDVIVHQLFMKGYVGFFAVLLYYCCIIFL